MKITDSNCCWVRGIFYKQVDDAPPAGALICKNQWEQIDNDFNAMWRSLPEAADCTAGLKASGQVLADCDDWWEAIMKFRKAATDF